MPKLFDRVKVACAPFDVVKPDAVHLKESARRRIVTFRFLREMSIDDGGGSQSCNRLNQYDYRDGCKSVPRGWSRFREEFSTILFAGSMAPTLGCGKFGYLQTFLGILTILHLLFAGLAGLADLAGASIPQKRASIANARTTDHL